jgi:hypothetical protein
MAIDDGIICNTFFSYLQWQRIGSLIALSLIGYKTLLFWY